MTDKPIPKTITATEASNNFGRMMSEVADGSSLFVVTRMGRPLGVVIGVEQYRQLLDELETVQERGDASFMAAITEAREDIQLGRTLTLDELDEELEFTEN